jgi:hypothetical protein
VGYNLGKRLLDLQKQTDEDLSGRVSLKRASMLVFFLLVLARFFVLPLIETPSHIASLSTDETSPQSEEQEKDLWVQDIQKIVHERVAWIESSPFILIPGASYFYEQLAQSMDGFFTLVEEQNPDPVNDIDPFFTFSDIPLLVSRMLAGAILRIGFLLCFSPLWILGAISGYALMQMHNKRAPSETILGVCDRGNGPFYSGIYGPYRPNNSFSGTDLSAPGLACPKMADKSSVEKTALAEMLEKYNAKNETTIQLLQIIHAHASYPHFVEPESSIQQEETSLEIDIDPKISQTGFVSNEKGLLLTGVQHALPAVLEAHTVAKRYIENLKKQKFTARTLNENYPSHIKALEKVSTPLKGLSKTLLFSMTPNKLWALAETPTEVIASAYLAIEAGKALVYKPHGASYSRISLYPHLQARAVIQSIIPYHSEFDGDTRLIIRQAIISSRRHGDFGRAFLPIRMPIKSRALRDWLEILYTETDRQEEVASLVELDAHIEELHVNFRTKITEKIKSNQKEDSPDRNHKLWKGLVHKSVVLLPLEDLVNMSIGGFHRSRLKKIAQLLDTTRKYQAQITTSARLPGFKRQAMEADKSGEELDLIVQKIRALPNGNEIYDTWRIVRRMLTKYNWLSTRIGDDSVPLVGVVHGILKIKNKDETKKHLFMDALVPLRQRRYNEILGRHWENTYYRYSPNQGDIEIFTQTSEYENQLRAFKAEPAPEEIQVEDKELAAG